MAEKRISSADLSWVVLEELKSGGKLSQHVIEAGCGFAKLKLETKGR